MGAQWEYNDSTGEYRELQWEYSGNTMGVQWEYRGIHGITMGVQWEYDGSTVGVRGSMRGVRREDGSLTFSPLEKIYLKSSEFGRKFI
jgi:hypothetical protein